MRALIPVLVMLAACESTQADPRPSAYDQQAMLRLHMREHYNMLAAIQHLVIRDDLYDVRAIAQLIGSAPTEPGLGKWTTQAGLARTRATELAAAPGNDEACRRTARLAEACARCHVDANVVPFFGSPPPAPGDDNTTKGRMAQHVWATDRLYEGMIGAENSAWLAGLDMLAKVPAPWSVADADRQALAQRMQELARRTREQFVSADLGARAHAYGEILVTCSACHAADRASAK